MISIQKQVSHARLIIVISILQLLLFLGSLYLQQGFIDRLRAENDLQSLVIQDLRGQIRNWQAAAIPALRAVGLKPEKAGLFYGSDVNPTALFKALNPCYAGDWRERGIAGSACEEYRRTYKEIPIKIIYQVP
jgi:hypothetical protein